MHRFLPAGYRSPLIALACLVATFTAPVYAQTSNRAPTISGTPSTSVEARTRYEFIPAARDADGDSLRFSVRNKPTWAYFNSSTGRLYGTPSTSQVGTYSGIEIGVSDGTATAYLPRFSITVSGSGGSGGNSAPTISGTPSTSIAARTRYEFIPTARDADGDALRFSVRNKPAWAYFSSSTGRLYGTPSSSQVGTYSGIEIGVSDGTATTYLARFSISVGGDGSSSSGNSAPRISGSPATSAEVGTIYSFRPTASDADGDTLRFSIRNQPAWASFSASTGRLYGTPTSAHAGSYPGIEISVSDGTATTRLAPFSITVGGAGSDGSARLHWTAPVLNTDGTPITDLAEYRVHYGLVSGRYDYTLATGSASITSMEIEGLAPGTWYFAVKAVNRSGVESAFSREANKTVL
jgi:hypothetical protein